MSFDWGAVFEAASPAATDTAPHPPPPAPALSIQSAPDAATVRRTSTYLGDVETPHPNSPLPDITHESRLYDDRRRCSECLNRAHNGRCIAAAKGLIVAIRTYTPNPDLLRRCEEYTPKPNDTDQRHGRARWPGLV